MKELSDAVLPFLHPKLYSVSLSLSLYLNLSEQKWRVVP